MSADQGERRTLCGPMELTARPAARLLVVRFSSDIQVTGVHGAALVAAASAVMGGTQQPFGLLADAAHVTGADADYRTITGRFFAQHREGARVALFHLGPILRVVAEMMRVGIGMQLGSFGDEAAARDWLRSQGIAA